MASHCDADNQVLRRALERFPCHDTVPSLYVPPFIAHRTRLYVLLPYLACPIREKRHMEQRLMGRCVRFTRNGHTEYGFWIANVRFGRIGHVGVRGCVAMRHAKCRTSRRGASGILLRGYSNDRAITCCADDAVAASHHRPIPAPQQPQSCPSHWNRCWR